VKEKKRKGASHHLFLVVGGKGRVLLQTPSFILSIRKKKEGKSLLFPQKGGRGKEEGEPNCCRCQRLRPLLVVGVSERSVTEEKEKKGGESPGPIRLETPLSTAGGKEKKRSPYAETVSASGLA